MDAFEITEEKLPRAVKGLVENHDFIGVSDIGRRPLRRKDKTNGCVYLGDGEGFWPRVTWKLDRKADGATTINFQHQISPSRYPVSQVVKLEGVHVTFGIRAYLLCPACGSMRCKLYVGPAGYLSCRDCLGLVHQSTRDCHSKPILRQLRRAMKLSAMDARVKRIIYGGKHTRRAKALIRLTSKWLPTKSARQMDVALVER